MTQQLTEVARSRFKLLDRPIAAPGKCAVCGAVDRPVIDFDLDLEYFGVVYFCVTCLTQVAIDNLDLVEGNDLRATQLIVDELNIKLGSVTEATDDYIANIRNLHDNFVSNISGTASLPDDLPESGSEGIHESDNGERHSEIRGPGTDESSPDGSTIVERPVSVPTNSSDGSEPFSILG